MNLKFYSLLFISSLMLLAGCKSASKLYEKGRYDEAVEIAAKKLQKDPDDRKLLDVLQSAYRYAVEDHENSIRNHAASNNDLKWEWTYNEYVSLQRLYESIRNSPRVFEVVRPMDYSADVQSFREKAGEARYARGMALMNNHTKQSYRSAYQEFQVALGYIPGDLDIRDRMNEAFENAVVNVIVSGVEERSAYQYSSFSNRYRTFDDNILRYLQQQNGNKFIRYYSAFEARNRNIRPDQLVDVRFSSLNIGRSQDDQTVRTVSKDVVIKETVHRPDSVTKEYAKVQAKITTTRRVMRSNGLLQVMIRDENNNRVWNEQYTGQHFWSTEYSTYTGDSRALSEEDKKMLNAGGNQQQPPYEEDIIRSIINELESKVECGIRDYYARYQ